MFSVLVGGALVTCPGFFSFLSKNTLEAWKVELQIVETDGSVCSIH